MAVTEDVPAYIKGYDKILDYDFDVFVPGHGNIANRDHIVLQKEYIDDLVNNTKSALQTINFTDITKDIVPPNEYQIIKTYFDAVSQHCADLTDNEWRDKIKGSDICTDTLCFRIALSLGVD
ncbi:MAG: hypothetical protein ACPKQO_10110 [Nitrososphaeraceae archaeon]